MSESNHVDIASFRDPWLFRHANHPNFTRLIQGGTNELHFYDLLVLVNILIDAQVEPLSWDAVEVEVEVELEDQVIGRVTSLQFDRRYTRNDLADHAALFGALQRLTFLTKLTLDIWSRIPDEIAALPSMNYLELVVPSNHATIPVLPNVDLPQLLAFCMTFNKDGDDDSSLESAEINDFKQQQLQTFLPWLTQRLPSLFSLSLSEFPPSFPLQSLETACFQNTLEMLYLGCSGLDSQDLAYILTVILPSYPNLRSISVPYSRIESLQPAATAVKESDLPHTAKRSLTCLDIGCNPVCEMLETDWSEQQEHEAESAALKCLFDVFKTLHIIHTPLPPNLLNLMRLNYYGRTLVEMDEGQRLLPKSMWPCVLERAEKKREDLEYVWNDPSGLYYLVRHGHSLFLETEEKQESLKRKRSLDLG